MEMYLLKSALCLAIFFTFYKVLLETTSIHNFKRFYLLAAVIISFGIPFITFTTYVDAPVIGNDLSNLSLIETDVVVESQLNYTAIVLWSVYISGLIFYGSKFIRNLYGMILKIRNNPKRRSNNIINVLLSEKVVPHTFFNYIFFNRQHFERSEIPQEVIDHEITHAREKHSLDVLLIELCRAVFWFNPLFYYISHAVKLNHEFIADRSVLRTGAETSAYQNTLLAFSSNVKSPQLANSINYSFIKKRFTVMKTKTSKKSFTLKLLLLLPLIAFTVYSFSSREEALQLSSIPGSEEGFINGKHPDYTDFDRWQQNDLYLLFLDGTQILNSEIREYHPDDLPYFSETQTENGKIYVSIMTNPFWQNQRGLGFGETDYQTSATREEMKEYTRLAKKYNAMPKEERIVKLKDLKRLEYIYQKMSPKQKADAEPFPECIPPPPPPPGEPDAPEPVKVIKGVNDTDANIPPPPGPPPYVSEAPIDHIIRMAGENAAFLYEDKRISSDEAIALLKANRDLNIETQFFDKSNPIVKISKKGFTSDNNTDLNNPPPPAPVAFNFEDAVKQGSTFYLNGKKVDVEKVRKISKDQSTLKSIDVVGQKNGPPKVYINN